MKAEVINVNSWKRELSVEVGAEEMAPYEERALHKFRNRVQIDGFRKGKVPLTIIRQRFQKALESEVSEDIAESFYQIAVQEQKLAPVAPGLLKDIQFKEGESLIFKAEVEVEPDVGVKDYKGIKIEKEFWKIKDQDVLNVIEQLRNHHAEIRPATDGAKAGFLLSGDIQSLDSTGVPIIGQKWEDRWIELGQPPLGDRFQSQLLGIRPGEERIVTLLEKVNDAGGKVREEERKYAIRVKSIQEKILPEVNEEFAKKIGNFDSIQAMHEGILKWLEVDRDHYVKQQTVQRIADQIVRRNDFELPPSLIEAAFQRFLEEFRKDHPENLDETELRKQNVPILAWNLKWRRIWPAIAKTETIEVTENEVDGEIEKQIQLHPKDEKRIRARYKDPSRRERLKNDIWENKVTDFLISHSKIKEVTIEKPVHQQSPIQAL